ncbi:hypothetical protein Bca52824_043818 [Brassica carinata]|uniref:Uncharacterized protein n=1 Tax=Brassica carinata TaxID=52824 RepID=A0A8X7V026_BRACI|nr:hypothetical protein Bca52824_043818 [Brassica carinata]
MAQFMKLLVTIALTFAITTAIITTTTTRTNTTTETVSLDDPSRDLTSPGAINIRRSRFLAEKDVEGLRPKPRSPNAPDFCEAKICSSTGGSSRMACCNNKCMNLSTDNKTVGRVIKMQVRGNMLWRSAGGAPTVFVTTRDDSIIHSRHAANVSHHGYTSFSTLNVYEQNGTSSFPVPLLFC